MNFRKFPPAFWALLQHDRFWAVVSAVAALGSTYFAYKTISDTNQTQQEEREAKRPYFKIDEPILEKTSEAGAPRSARLKIQLVNIGVRLAHQVDVRVFTTTRGKKTPLTAMPFKNANDIQASDGLSLHSISAKIPEMGADLFVMVEINYSDLRLNTRQRQRFYYTWTVPADALLEKDVSFELESAWVDEAGDMDRQVENYDKSSL